MDIHIRGISNADKLEQVSHVFFRQPGIPKTLTQQIENDGCCRCGQVPIVRPLLEIFPLQQLIKIMDS